MIFPNDVYNFLKSITTKMSQLPMRHPLNPQMFVSDESGNVVYMSRTGKVEEFIHTAIIQTIPQLIMSNPSLLPQDVNQVPPQVQLLQFMEMYGNYVGKYFNQQPNTTTTTGTKPNRTLPHKK